jgi:hypothetical protein
MARLLLAALLLPACSDYEVNKSTPEPTGGDTSEDVDCPDAAEASAVPTDTGCTVDAPVGTFTPAVEWQWSANPVYDGYDDIMSTPAVANLTDDDGDGDIDADDVPDVVFSTFAGGAYTSIGTLNAISGDGSGTWWSLYDAGGYHFHASGSPAIADIDGDGSPEVCSPGYEVAVVCVNADGSFKWAGGTEVYGYGSPAFADFDADGLSEVVFGREVLTSDGVSRWVGTQGAGWWLTFPVDLDGDGRLEVVAGNTVYRGNGDVLWTDGTGDGPGAVGDFDLDGVPEVVHVTGGTVVLTGVDGVVRWIASVPGGGGGPPTVADFDNDGYPEIGVAGAYYYSVVDTDGSILWSQAVQDYSSSVTGSSVFDFEGDGYADVVYADEVTLWVYDGATGLVKLQEDGHASGTLFEYPLIVDVDNDGSTEIVLASNNYAYSGYNGITVIGDIANSWRPSRPIWNQFAYHITNIEDDGGVPLVQEPNWERWNTFRAGGTTYGLSSDLADLTLGEPSTCCVNDGVAEVLVPVENTGLADTPEFYLGIYEGGSVLTGTTLSLAAGERREVLFTITHEDWRGASLDAQIDADRTVEECDEADNEVTIGAWPCGG